MFSNFRHSKDSAVDIGWYIYIAWVVLFVRQIYVAQAGLSQISVVKDDLEFLIPSPLFLFLSDAMANRHH